MLRHILAPRVLRSPPLFAPRFRYSTKIHVSPAPDDVSPPPQRPEHAVISTFDLFSIGGMYSACHPCRFPNDLSWTLLFSHRWADASRENLHCGLETVRPPGEGKNYTLVPQVWYPKALSVGQNSQDYPVGLTL